MAGMVWLALGRWLEIMARTVSSSAVTAKAVAGEIHQARQLPAGAYDANWFSFFNAMSWQITIGAPAILYAKSQGASATVLGIIAALTPLLVILQIPAAHLLPRYGYRRFILAGWGSRTLCIFALAVVPMLVFLDTFSRLALVMLLLFVFNLLRGMASGAWMPWMTQIIPEQCRGRFLSRDQFFGQVGCLVALTMAAGTLTAEPRPWQFSLVFLFSAIGATTSLVFIRRVPDVTAPEQLRTSGARVPWVEMMKYRPFLRVTILNLLFVMATGGVGVFAVAFLRSEAAYAERWIVGVSGLAVIGALFTLPYTARMIDRVGSRPILLACLGGFALILCGWLCVAAGLVGYPVVMIAGLYLGMGIAGVNYQVANNRLVMSIVPRMGRNHFFAIYTVTTNMAAGLAPIGWGLALDGIGGWHRRLAGMDWNRYSLFFALSMVGAVVTIAYAIRVDEQRMGNRLAAEVATEPQAAGTSPLAAGGVVAGMEGGEPSATSA